MGAHWTLLLWLVGQGAAQTDEGLVCALVFVPAARKKGEAAMVRAMRNTWGPRATLVRGDAHAADSFWRYLDDNEVTLTCPWLLLVQSVHTYVNMPDLVSALSGADASKPQSAKLSTEAQSPCLLSRAVLRSCRQTHASESLAKCMHTTSVCREFDAEQFNAAETGVVAGGYGAFAAWRPERCVWAVLEVSGWVHLHHIHDAASQGAMPARCRRTFLWRFLGLGREADSLDSHNDSPSEPPRPLALNATLCMFVPVVVSSGMAAAEVEEVAQMVGAARETWASDSTVFVLPPAKELPKGFVERLGGAQTTHLPVADKMWHPMFKSLYFWTHVLSLIHSVGSCSWALKIPLTSYVNTPSLEGRLACFNASMPWFFGATTAVYSPGMDPYMFPSNIAGTILSQGLYASVRAYSRRCIAQWAADAVSSAEQFFEDYSFALCLGDLGAVEANNYADIDASFLMFERPEQTLSTFWEKAGTVQKCLLVVGSLGNADAIRDVHKRITWSLWHESIPCIGATQTGMFSMVDGLGNTKPYYDERVRLALYYCKSQDMMELETKLSARLAGTDPRAGLGAIGSAAPAPAANRSKLCIFVPASARRKRFIEAAEAAWRQWGTADTYFVSTSPLSPMLDANTLIFDTDLDTDYAHLPVRMYLLFEALGRPEWVGACDWYMKADADSYVNVPLILERLHCFNPDELWYLGVPQVAHGSTGALTRFASGGAGYFISRALLPKLATWSPFCLLQLLQHTGGTGMEDVSLADCIWKWGLIKPSSYVDPWTEVITSDAAANRTRVAERRPDGMPTNVPACTFIVHSLEADQIEIVRENIERAMANAAPGTNCRPDEHRLRTWASTILAPEDETKAVEGSQWTWYGDREFASLLECSIGEV